MIVLPIGGQVFLFVHQMRDYTIAAQRMILVVDILHDLTITNGVVALRGIGLVALIESVPEQRDHRQTNRLLLL